MFYNQSAVDQIPGSGEPTPEAKFREELDRGDADACFYAPYVPEEDVELIRARHLALAAAYIRLI